MWNWAAKLQTLSAEREPFAIVTVTRCSGSTPRETGAKMFVCSDGRFFGTIGGGGLEKQAISDALRCLSEGQSRTLHFPLHAAVGQCCGGVVELLVEVMNSGPLLYIFGAGHVGQALVRTLADTPFRVETVDARPEWNATHCISPLEFVTEGKWDAKNSHVVIMTHDHELDYQLLKAILPKTPRFLGMIGSQNKWKSFQNQLQAAGFSPEAWKSVHCPVGLPIGGKSPQEVAISIAAELLKEHYEK